MPICTARISVSRSRWVLVRAEPDGIGIELSKKKIYIYISTIKVPTDNWMVHLYRYSWIAGLI